MIFDLIVIGGGAAGFYGAIQAADLYPGLKVLILEKSNKLLTKVRVSGGGRCNVTHHCLDASKLSKHYPRGQKALRSIFHSYQAKETIAWFASRHIALKTEADGRMFPKTDSSQTIINCFIAETKRLGIEIRTGIHVTAIRRGDEHFELSTASKENYLARRILIATGGSPRPHDYDFIRALGHRIRTPIPSLFTFNDTAKDFADLMGVSVPQGHVRIVATSYEQTGPLLVTHWGLSGPAVIKLSAWAAEYLHSVNYEFSVLVSWIGQQTEEDTRSFLLKQKAERPKAKIHSNPLYELPQRLWERLCARAEIPVDKLWGEAANRNVNKLLENLIRCDFSIKGKTTFKEEFVTCGGVDLSEIDLTRMESKLQKGVFFAGEVLNIDGETGGFNFQAAWSTAFVAASNAGH